MQIHTANPAERIPLRRTYKEVLIVLIYIGFGALTLWGTDQFGYLSATVPPRSGTAMVVDFPAVHEIWKRGEAVFVDARAAASFRRGHIPGAINVPINRVKQTLAALPADKETLLITYCGSIECPNAYQLLNLLLGHGYRNVRFLPRGLKGWQALGYPVETE